MTNRVGYALNSVRFWLSVGQLLIINEMHKNGTRTNLSASISSHGRQRQLPSNINRQPLATQLSDAFATERVLALPLDQCHHGWTNVSTRGGTDLRRLWDSLSYMRNRYKLYLIQSANAKCKASGRERRAIVVIR